MLPDRLLSVLARVDAQLDLIWGGLDQVHPDPAAQHKAIRRVRPDATLRVVPGAGHWMMYEQLERFVEMLIDLLDAPRRGL